MEEGLPCSIVGCGYITPTKVPDEAEMQYKVRLMELQMDQLQIHRADAHNIGGGAGQAVRAPGIKAKMDTPKLQLGVGPILDQVEDIQDYYVGRWRYSTKLAVQLLGQGSGGRGN